jgi:hypothetical protein
MIRKAIPIVSPIRMSARSNRPHSMLSRSIPAMSATNANAQARSRDDGIVPASVPWVRIRIRSCAPCILAAAPESAQGMTFGCGAAQHLAPLGLVRSHAPSSTSG